MVYSRISCCMMTTALFTARITRHQASRQIEGVEVNLIKILLALVAWTILLRPGQLIAAEPKSKEALRLRVGLGSSPVPPLPNSVLWLANDLGFYQREGLDVELIEFQGTPLALAAMISGDIDVGNVSTSEVIRLSATKGAPMRALHSPDARLYFLIAARDEIKTVQALQGKSFAVARLGSIDHTQSMLTLKARSE